MAADQHTAERRARSLARATYPGKVVYAGTPKPELYAELTPSQRLAQMSALCRAQWLASHGRIEERPRAEWPGEVFMIARG